MDELLKELNTYWHEKSDPRYPGEHPKCDEIHEEIIDILKDMQDDELEALLSELNEDQLCQINYPLEEIQDEHPCVIKYKQY